MQFKNIKPKLENDTVGFDFKVPTPVKIGVTAGIIITLVAGIVVGSNAFYNKYYFDYQSPIIIQSPILVKERSRELINPMGTPTPATESAQEATESASIKLIPVAHAAEPTPEPKLSYTGKVSSYSHAGCLGCGEKQIMGNGQPFDENAMTLAVPCELILDKTIRYNTKVRVTNLDNGLTSEATITDCGGFAKYDRVADLSHGLALQIGAKTNNHRLEPTEKNGSNVKIELL